jgi:uncharacterized protein (TIGR00369 family)
MEKNFDPHGGFTGLIGLEYETVGPDGCVLTLEVDDRHLQPYGIVHGGIYSALAETAASTAAALSAMEHGISGAVGLSNTTDFLRSHRSGPIRATATPIHRGRSQQLWQVDVTRDLDGALLARGKVRLHNLVDPAAIGGLSPEE